MPTTGYLPQLDGLRLLAFLLVFLNHSAGLPLGWTGVDLFFSLSGFLVTGILIDSKHDPRYFARFYARRTMRIFPVYYLFLAVTYTLFPDQRSHGWYWYAMYLGNVRDALNSGGLGHLTVTWSLSIEEQFYLIWPILVYVLPRKRFPLVLAGIILAAPVLRGLATPHLKNYYGIYCFTAFRLDTLALGALIAHYTRSPLRISKKLRSYLLLSGPAFLTIFCTLAYSRPSFRTGANSLLFNTVGYSLVAAMATYVLTISLYFNAGWMRSWLCQPTVRYLGKITYSSYLFHQTVLTEIQRLLGGNSPMLLPLGLVSTFLLSHLIWRFVEQPILSLRPRYDGDSPTSDQVADLAA